MGEQEMPNPEGDHDADSQERIGMDDETRSMKTLLIEEYSKRGENFFEAAKKWRLENPGGRLSDAIRALYKLETGE